MILTYEAIDSAGHRTKDSIDANGPREAVDALHRRGLFVTSINESRSQAPTTHMISGAPDKNRLPLRALVLFTRQMAMLLRAGSGLVPAIQAVRRQLKKPTQAAVLDGLATDLEEGATLTESMRKHHRTFDPVYCAIVAAGEASATLPEMFSRLADIVGKQRAMRNKIMGSLAYPTLLIGLCTNILMVLLFFVLPRFAQMFKQLGVETPTVTRVLLGIGETLIAYWPAFVGLALLMIGGGIAVLYSRPGRQWLSNIQVYLPVVGRLRARLIQAQVLRTMGMLVEARVGVLESLELARKSTRNAQFQRLFDSMEQSVTAGGQLSSALSSSWLMEPYVGQAVHTGEESGNLGEAMLYCADVLDESNSELVNVVARLIEPAILISMGIVVGIVAMSLFIPLFDLTSAIK